MIEIEITVLPKPRMTQRDRFLHKKPFYSLKKRDQAHVLTCQKYWVYAEELRLKCKQAGYVLEGELNATFIIQMPKSWSEKKKIAMDGKPHQPKNGKDLDNLEKSIQDILLSNDSAVYRHNTMKIWGRRGKIIFNSLR